jgi:hypothetical protein
MAAPCHASSYSLGLFNIVPIHAPSPGALRRPLPRSGRGESAGGKFVQQRFRGLQVGRRKTLGEAIVNRREY